MSKTRKPRHTKTPTAPAETAGPLDHLWVRVLLALWIIGIIGYYGREQLLRLLRLWTP